jgi:ABC-type antimicrobial peptide transport system permease subunit
MLFARAELARTKLRFAGLTLGTGLLIFLLLFQQALLAAILDGMAGAVKHQSGPIIVFTKDARRNLGGGLFPGDKIEEVKAVPGVGAVAGLGVGGLGFRAESGGPRRNISVIGYRRGEAGSPTSVRSGRLPEAPDEIVVSVEGAQGVFGVGDTLTFEPGDVKLKVVGLTEGALLGVGPAVFMSWETYESIIHSLAGGKSSSPLLPAVLAVQPAEGSSVTQVIDALNKVPGVDAMTREAAAEAAPGRAAIGSAFLTVMLLFYLVVGVVIGFFFLTITLQKEQSITMLRAVGANIGYLISCLLYEVAVVLTGGIILGVFLLYVAKPALTNVVIINVNPVGIAVTALPALLVGLAGTIPAVRRMVRIDPNAVVSRPALGSVR